MPRSPLADTVLAVVRSARELTAVVSRRVDGSPTPKGTSPEPSAASLYEVHDVPLSALPKHLHPAPHLAAAWDRLANATPADPLALADVLWVMLSTVPSLNRWDLAPLQLDAAAPRPRSTAAHPRAFKGTHIKPPKRAAPAPCDLRGHVCLEPNAQRLLEVLWPHRAAAARRLRDRGIDDGRLRRLMAPARPPRDPYLTFHHEAPPAARMSPGFVERLLPSLRTEAWPAVRRAAALNDRLQLSGDRPVAALAARVLGATTCDLGLAWWAALELLPVERRAAFLAVVLETGAHQRDPASVPRAAWIDLGHHIPADRFERWARLVLDGLVHRRNIRYLAAGLRFAELAPDARVPDVEDAPDFDDDAGRLLERLLPPSWDGGDLLDLWVACGAIPSLASHLRQTDWTRFSPTQARYLLRFLINLRWHARHGVLAVPPWHAIRACLPHLETRLREVDDSYAGQYLDDVGIALDAMHTPAEISDRLPLAIELLARLNRPPFRDDGNVARAVSNLLRIPAAPRRRVLEAAEASFLRLDKACRRENDAWLIAWGLSSLVKHVPELVADAFVAVPGVLFRTARELGVLSWESRRELVGSCASRPVFARDLASRPLPELIAVVGAAVVPTLTIIPRALREHMEGRRRLRAAQIERHVRVIRDSLSSLRLAVLQAEVDRRLTAAVGARRVRSEALPALAMLQRAEDNRRGLRRFLRAYLNGDTDYLRRHPATLAWVRRHSRIDIDVWTQGLTRHVAGRDGRELTIRLEHDALEVLKMGTYVGSCLGLGGPFSSLAAAALLDINKQVLYARDAQGTVVARQLVAITDDDRLASFPVYPASARRTMQREFDDYDRRFAAALGIPRLPNNAPYDVELVLARDWYDDGAAKG